MARICSATREAEATTAFLLELKAIRIASKALIQILSAPMMAQMIWASAHQHSRFTSSTYNVAFEKHGSMLTASASHCSNSKRSSFVLSITFAAMPLVGLTGRAHTIPTVTTRCKRHVSKEMRHVSKEMRGGVAKGIGSAPSMLEQALSARPESTPQRPPLCRC